MLSIVRHKMLAPNYILIKHHRGIINSPDLLVQKDYSGIPVIQFIMIL